MSRFLFTIATFYFLGYLFTSFALPIPEETEDEDPATEKTVAVHPMPPPQPFAYPYPYGPPMPGMYPPPPQYPYPQPQPDPKTGFTPQGQIGYLPPRTPPGYSKNKTAAARPVKKAPKAQEEEPEEVTEKPKPKPKLGVTSTTTTTKPNANDNTNANGKPKQWTSSYSSKSETSYKTDNDGVPVVLDKGYIVVKENGKKEMKKYKYGEEVPAEEQETSQVH